MRKRRIQTSDEEIWELIKKGEIKTRSELKDRFSSFYVKNNGSKSEELEKYLPIRSPKMNESIWDFCLQSFETFQDFVNKNNIWKRGIIKSKYSGLDARIRTLKKTDYLKEVIYPKHIWTLNEVQLLSDMGVCKDLEDFKIRFNYCYKEIGSEILSKLTFNEYTPVENIDFNWIKNFIKKYNIDCYNDLIIGARYVSNLVKSMGLDQNEELFSRRLYKYVNINTKEEIQEFINKNPDIINKKYFKRHYQILYLKSKEFLDELVFSNPRILYTEFDNADLSVFQEFIIENNIHSPSEFYEKYPQIYHKLCNSNFNKKVKYIDNDKKNTSFLEQKVLEYLENKNISVTKEKKFSDLKHINYLRYDTYFEIDGKKFVIEAHGIQHFIPFSFSHSQSETEESIQKTFILSRKKDILKYRYAKDNDINLFYFTDNKTFNKAKKIINNKDIIYPYYVYTSLDKIFEEINKIIN